MKFRVFYVLALHFVDFLNFIANVTLFFELESNCESDKLMTELIV